MRLASTACRRPKFRDIAKEAGRDPASIEITSFALGEDLDRVKRVNEMGVACVVPMFPPDKADGNGIDAGTGMRDQHCRFLLKDRRDRHRRHVVLDEIDRAAAAPADTEINRASGEHLPRVQLRPALADRDVDPKCR